MWRGVSVFILSSAPFPSGINDNLSHCNRNNGIGVSPVIIWQGMGSLTFLADDLHAYPPTKVTDHKWPPFQLMGFNN